MFDFDNILDDALEYMIFEDVTREKKKKDDWDFDDDDNENKDDDDW